MTDAAHAETKTIFVCTGNTCRSVMAEWIARYYSKGGFHFESAGIRPQRPEDAQNAIQILREVFKIDASSHIPRDVKTFPSSFTVFFDGCHLTTRWY